MWFTHDSNQSIPAVPILSQGISGAFAQSVPEYGMALVYPEAFDSLVILTSQSHTSFP